MYTEINIHNVYLRDNTKIHVTIIILDNDNNAVVRTQY